MAAILTQIRVIYEEPDPLKYGLQLWNFLSIQEASPSDFFTSIHNKKIIIFKFLNQTTRDKAINLNELDNKLVECKLKLHGPANLDSVQRTIFVNNLPNCLFYFFDPDTL